MKQIALSGIKPTGTLHIGNYLGMIKPAFDLVENYQTLYFVADYHALTTLKDKDTLNQNVYDVAATLLALGLDPQKVIFFRQSDIPQIFEFTWILNCFAAKGLLNRAHAYRNGGLAYSEIKQAFYELLNEFFGGRRKNYHQLMDDKDLLDRILNDAADKAKALAGPVLESVRRAIGIRRS